mmetsp:Transcript_35874/g.111065  ORF Transcript_35874/g.111065 Transcript_35874/m.111065 type:complete len:105 (+) Transcript_35874:1004-1318(+)
MLRSVRAFARRPARAAALSSQRSAARAKRLTVAGIVTFVGVMGCLPLFIRNRMDGSLTAADRPLTGSQVQRGQFMNSGSKDAGRDPDWVGNAYRPQRRRRDGES